MRLQNKLKLALKDFLDSEDDSTLLTIIEEHTEVVASNNGDYPDFHRIADICLGPKWYRVCRQISENEKITLAPIDKPIDNISGVPIWLEGEKLKKWAESEEDYPSQSPIDWNSYR